MAHPISPPGDEPPAIYQIRIKGHIGQEWTDWLGGLSISRQANGDTLLTGPLIDQSALYGVLRSVRDLGMPLLELLRLEPEPAGGERDRVALKGQTGKGSKA